MFAPLSALLILVWARASRTPWRDLGFVRPESWGRTVVVGILFGVVFKLAMKVVVMPLLGADPINHAYHYLAGNRAALPGMLITVIVSAGFAEETIYRSYLFERLGKLFGKSAGAKVAIVALTSVLFAAAHGRVQGLAGVEQAAVTGLVFGAVFAVTGQIFPLMIAHAAFDVTAVWIIYADLETTIAHWILE